MKEDKYDIIDEFSDSEWDHLIDCIFNVLKEKYTENDAKSFFKSLPFSLKEEALDFGMSDTAWQSNLTDFLNK